MAVWSRRALETVRRFIFPAAEFSPEERAELEEQRLEANRSRTAGVLPVLALVQAAMLVVFQPRADGLHAEFRAGIFRVHALVLPFSAALSVAAWLGPRYKVRLAWLGDAVLVLAVALGLSLSLNTHHLVPNLNALNTALFAGTLIVRPTLAAGLLAYGGAIVGLLLGLGVVQPDAELRLASATSGITAVLVSFAFARVLDVALVRDVRQRLTIARQKSELEAWNAELGRRVEAQVNETLVRASEVRALDAQLRVRVRERSRELSRALRSATQREAELSPGTRFEHRFDIERHIGEGAMGDVYAARDHASGQAVALKVLRRSEEVSPVDLERFVAEAAAAAMVVHPAIVRTFLVDVSAAGQFYLVMELLLGRTLAADLERGRFGAGQTARLGAVVAEALAAAHAAGVVHRDIKPGNLMLTRTAPGVRVLDFGVSKLADAEQGEMTGAGQVLGTPLYMAPEQVLRAGAVTGACDVYALGQVMYEMLTGQPCFSGKTVREVLRAQLSDAPVSVRSRAGHGLVPDDLAALIGQCLEKAPEARPGAESLAAALRVIAESLGAPALEEIGPPQQGPVILGELDIGAATVRADL